MTGTCPFPRIPHTRHWLHAIQHHALVAVVLHLVECQWSCQLIVPWLAVYMLHSHLLPESTFLTLVQCGCNQSIPWSMDCRLKSQDQPQGIAACLADWQGLCP